MTLTLPSSWLMAPTPQGDPALLELEARRRAWQVVERFPGLHLGEIARQAGLDSNHARYHLDHLEKHGLVSSRREGGRVHYFPRTPSSVGPRDVLSPAEKRTLALLRRPGPLHIVLRLLQDGPSTPGALAAATDMTGATLHYHLRRLEREGIVEGRLVERDRFYHVREADQVVSLLLQYRPPDPLVQGFLEAWEALELD